MNKNKWFLNGGRGSGKTFRLLCETYENKIADLEKENAELQKSYEELYNSMRVIKDQRNVLEKENAELKLKLEALEGHTPWKDIKDKSEVTGQLTKAKELLKKLLVHSKRYIWIADDNNKPIMQKEITEAEQFLNSEVEK